MPYLLWAFIGVVLLSTLAGYRLENLTPRALNLGGEEVWVGIGIVVDTALSERLAIFAIVVTEPNQLTA